MLIDKPSSFSLSAFVEPFDIVDIYETCRTYSFFLNLCDDGAAS